MKDFKYIWILGLIVTALIVVVPILLFVTGETQATDSPWNNVPNRVVPATDHSDLMPGPYETGSEVTEACLNCHEDAAFNVMQTTHWTWKSKPVEVEDRGQPISVGKANAINNFCIGIQSNWTGCTRCHTGYGWEDEHFDFTEQSNVDCLVCHDQSRMYVKGNSGLPVEGVDLAVAAQSVGLPTRENCGGCHFNGGGGDAVKHGDMDETLYYPSDHLDVHMGRHDFVCVDCHQTEDHNITGRAISVNVETNNNQIHCTDCHSPELHGDDRITAHIDTLACQTCHIPSGALRAPTKMEWDWSAAGNDNIEENVHEYLKIKGSFIYESKFLPEYGWYNGEVDRYLLGDKIDPEQITTINQPLGDITDPNARIWPFKVHHAQQIYDAENSYLIQPKTVGEGGYWTEFDWDLAARLGSEAVGMDYSGSYDFASTRMYWTLSHMVQPSEHALQCNDCHGPNGRMDWEALGYYGDPIRWGGRADQFTGLN